MKTPVSLRLSDRMVEDCTAAKPPSTKLGSCLGGEEYTAKTLGLHGER